MIGILLAAGRGTRMKSDKPKVLFEVNDEPLCFGPARALAEICSTIVVIVGYKGEDVKHAILQRAYEEFGENAAREKFVFLTQDPPLGTGDAVRIAIQGMQKSVAKDEEVLVVNGDLPLIRKSTLLKFAKAVREQKVWSACMSTRVASPTGLGRILRDETGVFIGIREEKDASVEERKIKEINGGVYYFKYEYLETHIKKLKSTNAQNEFYLTDLLGNAQRAVPSAGLALHAPFDLLGVNNTLELSNVRRIAQYRLQRKLCLDLGLEMLDPASVYVSARATFGTACSIGPNVVIRGRSQFGNEVRIDGNAFIFNTTVADSARILWGSVIEDSKIGCRTSVGPMAHLRPLSILGDDVKVGNFVELKKTVMKRGSKASHLSYLGDAEIGEESNIGCGTITCNYDGFSKHMTKIGARAFIGSDTQLVAPVTVGDGAYVGSGTTVTEDVPAGALALSRAEMVIKENYAAKLEAKRSALKRSKAKKDF